jgi:hypothetical protein
MPTDATRRQFLAGTSAFLTTMIVGAAASAREHDATIAISRPPRTIYRLSCRGRRCSQAAKLHNANLRFATIDAAARHRAHPGDTSRIVALTVSQAEYERLFYRHRLRGGIRRRVVVSVADLRHLTTPV